MSHPEDTDIVEQELQQGKFVTVSNEIIDSSNTSECKNCSLLAQSNVDMKKELDAALNQKQVIEREYDNYMRSQELLYN